MAFPPHEEVENTLLCFIYRHGGSKHEVRASDTYGPLAYQFQLSAAEHTQSFAQQDGPKWNDIVQQARNRLYESGYLDPTAPPGVWRLSAEGIAEAERICSEETEIPSPNVITGTMNMRTERPSANITAVTNSPLTDDDLRAIGRVTNAWNVLEATVEATIWGFAKFTRKQGNQATCRLHMLQRCHMLEGLERWSGLVGQRIGKDK